jgi:hypothetical protein
MWPKPRRSYFNSVPRGFSEFKQPRLQSDALDVQHRNAKKRALAALTALRKKVMASKPLDYGHVGTLNHIANKVEELA